MIPIVIATIVFGTQFECIQHLDEEVTYRPKNSRVSGRRMDKAIVSLDGAFIVLQCKGGTYTANLF